MDNRKQYSKYYCNINKVTKFLKSHSNPATMKAMRDDDDILGFVSVSVLGHMIAFVSPSVITVAFAPGNQ